MSIKKHITDTMKKLYQKKYISIRDGNVSFKPKNANFFYISAGSVKKNEINEDQIIKVGFTGTNIYYNKSYKYKPSREIDLHSLLQMDPKYHNKDTFVVHAHPPNLISYIGINESKEFNVKLFVDDDPNKVGKIISGIKIVYLNDVDKYIKKFSISSLIVAIPSLSLSKKRELIIRCENLNVNIKTWYLN